MAASEVQVHRIIPAYAGSTVKRACRYPSMADHPRIRGEHSDGDDRASGYAGSSPHTRGAPRHNSWTNPLARDHPRIRGEHGYPKLCSGTLRGSSPHTRGALARALEELADLGIIPAYAGSTQSWIFRSRPKADHPRIRGEHSTYATSMPTRGGSSPHTRGARRRVLAGYRELEDHPRIRGEHASTHSSVCGSRGSSPHTRGALPDVHGRHRRQGIIPAYAGSTPADQRRTQDRPDHPRIRGEHSCSR